MVIHSFKVKLLFSECRFTSLFYIFFNRVTLREVVLAHCLEVFTKNIFVVCLIYACLDMVSLLYWWDVEIIH